MRVLLSLLLSVLSFYNLMDILDWMEGKKHMARSYNIVERLAAKNIKPYIQVTEDLTVEVNNTKTTVLHFMAVEKDEKLDDIEKMDKMLEIALGKKNAQAIEELDLSFESYTIVFEAVSAALTGEELEEIQERFPETEELN